MFSAKKNKDWQPPPSPKGDINHLNMAVKELYQTEKSYIKQLNIIDHVYRKRLAHMAALGHPLISTDEINKLFINIQDLLSLHNSLFSDLKTLKHQNLLVKQASSCLCEYCPYFRGFYIPYVNIYRSSIKLLHHLLESNAAFAFFITIQDKCEGNNLESFLICPVQRIPRYILLLKTLQKFHHDEKSLEQINHAIIDVESVADFINASMETYEQRVQILKIQENVFGNKVNLCSPTRVFLKHGPLIKVYNNQIKHFHTHKEYLFILFNDILIYASPPGIQKFCDLKHVLSLEGLTVTDMADTPEIQFSFFIKSVRKNFLVFAQSLNEKTAWMTKINDAVVEFNKQLASKKIRSGDPLLLEDIIKRKRETALGTLIHTVQREGPVWINMDGFWYNKNTGETKNTKPDDLFDRKSPRTTPRSKSPK